MLKIPFQFFWNIQNVVLSSKQSHSSKNSMFCGRFNFDKNRCIRTLPAWPFFSWFFWLSFSNVENTLRILLKHSKFCSFINTISLKQKQHVLRTFQFWPKSLYPDLTGVTILLVDFFGRVFQMLKIPFEFFWNIQNFVLSSKQSVWSKNSMFCGLFNFDQNRCIRTSPAWPFFWLIFWCGQKCWKYPSNSSETFKILFFHQNNQFEAKTACFADFSILTKIAVSGPYRRGHFVGWFFEMLKIPFEFFWNIQNFVLSSKQSVWSKNSMFCGLFNFDQNRCIRTLPAWPFCWLIFWLSFSNVENTLRILLKHSKFCSFIKTISLKQKQHVLRTFQFWPKSLYLDLTGVAIFFGWFFEMLKIPFEFFWKIQNFVLSSKQSVWSKNSMFCGLFNFDQNRCIRTLPAWAILLVDFFAWVFQMLKIPFEFFWNIQNFVLSSKQSVWSKNSMFCGLFNFDQNRCIRNITGVAIFFDFFFEFFKCWKYPSNSSETFKILFFHQNNQFEAKTACFADFSILTKIAVSGPYRRGHFFRWFFEMLKIPFEFFWKIQNFVLSSKQSVWSKNSMFCGLFNFDQNRCIRTLPAWAILLVDFFGWAFQMLKIPFEFFWNIQNFVLSSKQSVWSKNSMFCGLFNFDQNRCIPNLPVWPFFFLDFLKCWKYPSNSSEKFKILFFIKTISLKQKQHVLRTFQFWPTSLYLDLTGVAIFLVDFLKCWKYPSNSSETFKILFFHQNNQFEAKTACFADFSILTKIAVSGPYRRDNFVGWFFWLSFSNVENTLRILLKHSKFCSFINTISLKQKHSKCCSFIKTITFKQKQHVLRTFQFWRKSLYPDITGVAIF